VDPTNHVNTASAVMGLAVGDEGKPGHRLHITVTSGTGSEVPMTLVGGGHWTILHVSSASQARGNQLNVEKVNSYQ
jgi:hypothetical protein